MDRRSLLRGLFAAPAIVAASSLMPGSVRALMTTPPRLWGDGIHDDTAALNWLAREAVRKGKPFVLMDSIHRLSGPIVIDGATSVAIINTQFRIDDGTRPAFDTSNCGSVSMVHTRIATVGSPFGFIGTA